MKFSNTPASESMEMTYLISWVIQGFCPSSRLLWSCYVVMIDYSYDKGVQIIGTLGIGEYVQLKKV